MPTSAKASYFTEVAKAMRAQGFVLFSRVTITTDSAQYHVPAKYARNTRLFFHYPQRNCILVLSYTEHEWSDDSKSNHWSMILCVQYAPGYLVPQRRFLQERRDDAEFEMLTGRKAPADDAIRDEPSCNLFCHSSSMSGGDTATWNLDEKLYRERKTPLSPSEIATSAWELVADMLDELRKPAFKELQVTHWDPSYAFPFCGPLFWQRFRESSQELTGRKDFLWSIVKKPWGSDGLRR